MVMMVIVVVETMAAMVVGWCWYEGGDGSL